MANSRKKSLYAAHHAGAATTSQIYGFECAVVPFDMGVEAEALGTGVNYYAHRTDIVYPTITKKVSDTFADLKVAIPDLSQAGRIPLVARAIELLKEQVGDTLAIGAWILGPYTLAGQLTDTGDLAKAALKKTAQVQEVLMHLAEAIIQIAAIYRRAGADYITIREMGGGPDIISPRIFAKLIQPPLAKVFSAMASPKVLHICGGTHTLRVADRRNMDAPLPPNAKPRMYGWRWPGRCDRSAS